MDAILPANVLMLYVGPLDVDDAAYAGEAARISAIPSTSNAQSLVAFIALPSLLGAEYVRRASYPFFVSVPRFR